MGNKIKRNTGLHATQLRQEAGMKGWWSSWVSVPLPWVGRTVFGIVRPGSIVRIAQHFVRPCGLHPVGEESKIRTAYNVVWLARHTVRTDCRVSRTMSEPQSEPLTLLSQHVCSFLPGNYNQAHIQINGHKSQSPGNKRPSTCKKLECFATGS